MGHELNPFVLIGIAVILFIGKVGGEIFERLRQPAVLVVMVVVTTLVTPTFLSWSISRKSSFAEKKNTK